MGQTYRILVVTDGRVSAAHRSTSNDGGGGGGGGGEDGNVGGGGGEERGSRSIINGVGGKGPSPTRVTFEDDVNVDVDDSHVHTRDDMEDSDTYSDVYARVAMVSRHLRTTY